MLGHTSTSLAESLFKADTAKRFVQTWARSFQARNVRSNILDSAADSQRNQAVSPVGTSVVMDGYLMGSPALDDNPINTGSSLTPHNCV